MVRVKQEKVTAEFKQYALRILSTSGRTIAQVAADLGIGKSTLQRAIATRRPKPDLIHHSTRMGRYRGMAMPRYRRGIDRAMAGQ